MRTIKLTSGAVLAAVLLIASAAGSAHAAFDKDELKCRKGIAKAFSKTISTGQKTIAKCHKSRNSGKIGAGVDCNVLDFANADPKGKFDKAQLKLAATLQKCEDSGIDLDLVREYASCPEPCATDEGLPSVLTSYGEVATCLSCYAGDIAERNGAATLGSPAAPMASKDDQKCHSTIAKSYGKYVSTALKERTKCQASSDKDGVNSLSESGCATADSKGKIAGTATKAADGINKSCPAATLANLDSCSAADLPTLIACLLAESDLTSDESFPAHFELEAAGCPVRVDTLIRAGVGQSGITSTFIEIGWTGTAHTVDLIDNYLLSAGVTCPGSEAGSCGDCVVDGVSEDGPDVEFFRRCNNDFRVECDNAFTQDNCGVGGLCVYVLGPPFPISAGNNPTCSINALSADITGTANPENGQAEIQVDLSTRVHTGGTASLTSPCPVCDQDDTPRDGSKDGVCIGGIADGEPCDVHGFDRTFAANENGQGVSMDCPPNPNTNITGTGLIVGFDLTTQSTSLAFENTCDPPAQFLTCACGQCSGDTAIPCRNDTECGNSGIGTCTTKGAGVGRLPNSCSDNTCTAIGDDKGECQGGGASDTLKFCDGVTTAAGDGFVKCNTDADCGSSDCGEVPCGNCTLSRLQKCFLDPIVDTGTPDVDNPIMVSTFCLAPTISAAINGTAGTPGPARIQIDMAAERFYF